MIDLFTVFDFSLTSFLLAGALVADKTQHGQPPGPPRSGPLTVHQLTPEIYWVEGGVGNCGFVIGEDGVIVIDATISPQSGKELLEHIARITEKPVKAVILTHGDIDHIGGLAAFTKEITIIAQQNNARKMREGVAAGSPMISADHLPNRELTTLREVIEFEGIKIELLHWAPAHTNGDLVVYLPDLKTVFTGDIFTMDQPVALIHRERHHGTSAGWIKTAKGIVALDAERFVVGHGGVQSRNTLEARIEKAETEHQKIHQLFQNGLSLEQIQVEVGDPPPGYQKPGPGGPRFTPFSEVVFQELTED